MKKTLAVTIITLITLPLHAQAAGGFMAINPAEMKARVITIDGPARQNSTIQVTSGEQTKASRFKPLNRDLLAAKYRMRPSNEKPVGSRKKAAAAPQDEAGMILSLFDDATISIPRALGDLIKGHSWPIDAQQQRLSSNFGMRSDPFSGKPAFHQGIDIATKQGTAVKASAEGIIKDVGQHKRLGRYVRIDHGDGVETQYGHLLQQSVRKGQRVRQGQAIGTVGSTGRSTGPHLDYSIRIDGEPVNPLQAVSQPTQNHRRLASDTTR